LPLEVHTTAVKDDIEEPINQRAKILLVDDTPENLIALEAALNTLGEKLVTARSGREALRHLLEEDDFAAILLDVRMPGMDGFETAELIRSRPRSRHTPILFLTGYRNEEHLFRGYDLGAVDFLFKPIVPEVLRSKVAVFVELSRKARQLQQQANELALQASTLQKAEQRFRSLLEAAPDAMVICHENGEIILVNSRTEALFGYHRTELLACEVRLLVPNFTTDRPVIDSRFTEEDQAVPEPIEFDGLRRDRSRFPVEVSISPLQSDEGSLLILAIRDISERKRAEHERAEAEGKVRELNAYLEELNASLEERVFQRTEELIRSNDELAQFASVASHDLREPLRTVSLYTQLLEKEYGKSLGEDGQLYLRHVIENSARMEQLIHDLLEFSSVDANTSDHFVPLSSEETLQKALTNLTAQIEASGAVITYDELPKIVGDAIQITRLFQNLIVNSIKYSQPGVTPKIHISVSAQGNEWMFLVQDNGIGIDPQHSERIFGIFKRLHGRENPGTGIGLAICKKIVSAHGGRIWVDSIPGKGTTVFFSLPCHSVAALSASAH
jgi:PAS domain S-box-containing protein